MANPLSQQERVSAEALVGQWKVLDLTAVPIEEKDVLSGEGSSNLFAKGASDEPWCVCRWMIFKPTCMLKHLAGCAGLLGDKVGSGSPKPAVVLGTYPRLHPLSNSRLLQVWCAR